MTRKKMIGNMASGVVGNAVNDNQSPAELAKISGVCPRLIAACALDQDTYTALFNKAGKAAQWERLREGGIWTSVGGCAVGATLSPLFNGVVAAPSSLAWSALAVAGAALVTAAGATVASGNNRIDGDIEQLAYDRLVDLTKKTEAGGQSASPKL